MARKLPLVKYISRQVEKQLDEMPLYNMSLYSQFKVKSKTAQPGDLYNAYKKRADKEQSKRVDILKTNKSTTSKLKSISKGIKVLF